MTFTRGNLMKPVLMRLVVSCASGLFAVQAIGAELASGYQRDCSKMAGGQKARCEQVNNAMAACAGKKAGEELDRCLKENKSKK
jgi:hypothetical protein